MNIRKKLLLRIGIILILTQVVIAIWVWHESQEQIEILTDSSLSADEKNTQIAHELNETLLALSIPSITLVSISLLLIYLSINRITAPLVQLNQAINQKSGYDLSPINIEKGAIEVNIIVEKLNLLLQRIADSMENERRFTADVAHELRTPLAGFRLNLEMVDEQDLPEKNIFIQRIDQLLMTIEQLLSLARAGHRLHNDNNPAIDLISEVLAPLRQELDDDFPHPINWSLPEKLNMRGDSSLLFLLFKNLFDNVRFYAPHSCYTLFSVHQQKDEILFTLIDNGPGVSESQLEKLTERFRRLDQSRNGFGLGLNIVERICQVHHASMQISNRHDGKSGLKITIRFPVHV